MGNKVYLQKKIEKIIRKALRIIAGGFVSS